MLRPERPTSQSAEVATSRGISRMGTIVVAAGDGPEISARPSAAYPGRGCERIGITMSLRIGFLIFGAGAVLAAGCDDSSGPVNRPEAADPSAAITSVGEDFYTYPPGNYRVKFPGSPQFQEVTAPSPAGPQKVSLAAVELPDGSAYSVIYSDNPPQYAKAPPSVILDAIADGQSQKGEFNARQPMSLDGHPGYEAEIGLPVHNGVKRTGKCRVFVVSPRVYQIIAVAPEGSYDEAAGARFLESFALLNPVEVTPPMPSSVPSPDADNRPDPAGSGSSS